MTCEIDTAKMNGLSETLLALGYTGFDGAGKWESLVSAGILAFDPRCKLYRIIESLPAHKDVFDELDFCNIFSHLGFSIRKTKVSTAKSHIDTRLLPCVGLNLSGTPLLLLSCSDGHYSVHDGGELTQVPIGELHGINELILIERGDENKSPMSRFMRQGTGYGWFRSMASRFKSNVIHVLSAGFFINVIALSSPLLTMLIYDRVIATSSLDKLPMLAMGGAMALAMEWVFRTLRSHSLAWFATRIDNIVSNQIFAQLMGLSPDMIERASVSSQIARIKTFESVRDFFNGAVFLSLIEALYTPVVLLAIWAIAGSMAIVPTVMMLAYCALFLISYKFIRVSIRMAARTSSVRQQFVIDTLEKVRTIREHGLIETWQNRYRDLSGREQAAHFRLNWQGSMTEIVAHGLTMLSGVITIAVGAQLIWSGAMSTGALVASMILVWRALTPFYSLCTMVPRLEQIRNSIIQVNTLMDLETETEIAKAAAKMQIKKGNIGFTHAAFRYSGESESVFLDLNINVKSGDLTVINGVNGSGKSSLLKIIKGLYPLSEGALQIDGFDIRQISKPDLRRQIAYVPQSPDFFSGSVLDNICIANPLASLDQVRQALDLADALQDVEAMSNGINTYIEHRGENVLPESLAARISLARAYLHDAPVLLIDELPNMIMCGKAGRNLRDYLARIKGQKTCFMVTYRDDLSAMADGLIEMSRGSKPVFRNYGQIEIKGEVA